MRRLFTGWRLTLDKESLYNKLHLINKKYPTLKEIIEDQAVPPLPGSMIPPIYSSNHGSNFLGIPTISKKPKTFNYNSWINKLSENFVELTDSVVIKELSEKIKDTNNIKKNKKIFLKMTDEYKKIFDIEFEIPDDFLDNDDLIIKLNPFRDGKTLTTLIKWSQDNMDEKTLVTLTNNKGYKYNIVKRYLNSLKKYNYPLYKPYTQEEIQLYKPNKL